MWIRLAGLHETKIKLFKQMKKTRLRAFVFDVFEKFDFLLFPILVGWDAPSIFALWLAARCAPMHVPVTKDVRMDRHEGLWMAGMQPKVVDKFFVRAAAALAWR